MTEVIILPETKYQTLLTQVYRAALANTVELLDSIKYVPTNDGWRCPICGTLEGQPHMLNCKLEVQRAALANLFPELNHA